jgi:hypothetical protein
MSNSNSEFIDRSVNSGFVIERRPIVGRQSVMVGLWRVLVGRADRKNHLEELSIQGRILLKWIF